MKTRFFGLLLIGLILHFSPSGLRKGNVEALSLSLRVLRGLVEDAALPF